jgi:beta-N-acetylhexosaminidase
VDVGAVTTRSSAEWAYDTGSESLDSLPVFVQGAAVSMPISAMIAGCAGLELSKDEAAFFRDAEPWGFILFKRNCDTPEQIRALVKAMRAAVGRDAPVLIDQEGGRVQRLGPPHWPTYPKAAAYGALYVRDAEKGLEAARLGARLIANDLAQLGIDIDCLPVLDVPGPDGHDVIGDRAYGRDAKIVSAVGRAAAEGLLDGGVLPVIKHMPGHGRAQVDSHKALPRVDAARAVLAETDFPAFKPLADMPLGMTAHVVYEAIDADNPATLSSKVISEVIRGEIGFGGALMTDDLSMHALSGDFGDRTKAALDAGCDLVLHCNGDMAEMIAVATACRPLAGASLERVTAALAWRRQAAPLDLMTAKSRFMDLLSGRG